MYKEMRSTLTSRLLATIFLRFLSFRLLSIGLENEILKDVLFKGKSLINEVTKGNAE
jgi:hypothetical protein